MQCLEINIDYEREISFQEKPDSRKEPGLQGSKRGLYRKQHMTSAGTPKILGKSQHLEVEK
jgi:hypothetical protein